jgi:hypothetical protein
VGDRVRRQSARRAQLDPAGRQLRMADGRRSRRHSGADRPRNPVGRRRSLAVGAGVLRWLAVGGLPSWRAALSDTGRRRRRTGRSSTPVRRTVRAAAHSLGRTGRHPVVHDQQPRRSWEPARRRRPYRSVPALTRTVQRTKRDECHCERIRVFAADVTARSAGVSVPLGTQRTNLDFGACGVVALSRQKAWRCGEFPCTPTELQR